MSYSVKPRNNRNPAPVITSRDMARARAASSATVDHTATLAANPHIGVLSRNGSPVYYVTTPEYREAADPRTLAS